MKAMLLETPGSREPLVVALLALVLGPAGVVGRRMLCDPVSVKVVGVFEDHRAILARNVTDVAVCERMPFQVARPFELFSAFEPFLIDMVADVAIDFVVYVVVVLFELARVAK
jgi:hypothetical protein